MQTPVSDLEHLYQTEFAHYREQEVVAEWRRGYVEHTERVKEAALDTRIHPQPILAKRCQGLSEPV